MNRNITHVNLAADAKTGLSFWEEHPELKLQETTCAQFRKTQTAFESLADECMRNETELRQQMTERDRLAKEVQKITSRLRSAVRGVYGPDSSEYEKVGGTRQSTRKRRTRRSTADETGAVSHSGNGNSGLITNGNGNRGTMTVAH